MPDGDLLDIYGELTGRTILMPAGLPRLDVNLTPGLRNDTNAAIGFIEAEFAKRGIEAVRDGGKFVKLVRTGWTNSPLAAQMARIQLPRAGGEEVPRGGIHWSSADLDLILAFYSDLARRTILRASNIACAPVRLKNHSSLTREEFIYAIKVLLALNSIAMIDDGDKFTQVVPFAQASEIQLRAPKPEKSATLIDPKTIPAFKFSAGRTVAKPPPPPPTYRQQILDKLSGLYTRARIALFGTPPPPPKPEADNLVAYYAKLTDTKPIPSKRFGKHPVFLEIKTPVTKAELLYAIEVTLGQSGLTIVSTNKNSIQILPRSELPSHGTNVPAKLKT